jgi:hypothetical protein
MVVKHVYVSGRRELRRTTYARPGLLFRLADRVPARLPLGHGQTARRQGHPAQDLTRDLAGRLASLRGESIALRPGLQHPQAQTGDGALCSAGYRPGGQTEGKVKRGAKGRSPLGGRAPSPLSSSQVFEGESLFSGERRQTFFDVLLRSRRGRLEELLSGGAAYGHLLAVVCDRDLFCRRSLGRSLYRT